MNCQDWTVKYDEIWGKYSELSSDTQRIQRDLVKKQEMYIFREQEYRSTIRALKG